MAVWQTSARIPMPAVQEIKSILIAFIKNLKIVQQKPISGLANSIGTLFATPDFQRTGKMAKIAAFLANTGKTRSCNALEGLRKNKPEQFRHSILRLTYPTQKTELVPLF